MSRAHSAARGATNAEIDRLESEVQELRTQLISALGRIDAVQEAERQRISRDLHDGLGQFFTVLQMELRDLGKQTGKDGALAASLSRLVSRADTASAELDRLAWEIRPPQLGTEGLGPAIKNLLEDWSVRSGVAFDCHIALYGRSLPTAIETTLFRVLQEAVRNVVKHAGASRAGVTLQATEAGIRMTIEDNGGGFERSDGSPGDGEGCDGQGLIGVRERLGMVEGTLEIETEPAHGTTLLIYVPFRG